MPKDFLHLTIDFFREHMLDITLTLLGILIIIIYIVIHNIQIDPPQPRIKGRTIVLEALSNKSKNGEMDKMLRQGFCKSNAASHTLEKNCNKLSKKSCNHVACCVYAHNKDTDKSLCVAGNGNDGPKYKADSNKNYYPYDYWYYLGKKYPLKN